MDLLGGFKKAMGMDTGAQDQSEDEKKLVSHIRSKIEDSRNLGQRIVWESNTMSNIAYLMGYDSVYWDTRTREFRNIATLGTGINRNRLRYNKLMPLAQNRCARLSKVPPKYDVRPNSSQTEDKDAARLALDIISMVWDRERINQKRIPLIMWAQQAGFSFVKTSWDECAGRMLDDGSYEGDVRIDVVSPLEIFVDPLATTMAECQWLIQAKVRKLDYFRERYENGSLVKEEDAWLLSTQYELRVNALNSGGPAATSSDVQMKNSAIELSYYEKPSKKHPEGRQVVSANGVLLEDKELPIGEIPFSKFDDFVIGGKFFSEAIMTHARPYQDYLNQLINKRAQWTKRLLAGKYIAPYGHGLAPEALDNESGELLTYKPNPTAPNGGEPHAVQVPVMPQYAYEEQKTVESALNDLFGLNEVSQGRIPSSGMPAAGMQILLEQDATRQAIVTENHEHSYADVGRHILKFVKNFYIVPRLLKTAGKGLEYTVKPFVGSDIRDNTDVYVIRGSTVPNSKVLQRQDILNTYQMGLLGDPQDPKLREKVLSMLEYGDVAEMWQDFSIDMAQINRDLDLIQKGGVPQVNELDNHPLHVQEKNRFRKSEKFEGLTPQIKTVLEANIEEHVQMMTNLTNPGLQQHVQMSNMMADKAQNMTPGQVLTADQVANAHMPETATPPPPGIQHLGV
jgi:hypothetical protein